MAQRAPALHKLTWRDWLDFPREHGGLHELIDGEHVVTFPDIPHQRAATAILVRLYQYGNETGAGEAFLMNTGVVLSEHDVLGPDVLFVSRARAGVVGPQFLRGAPDLVVEVLSPSTRHRDRGVKLHLYEGAGVDEYWLVDPALRSVSILRRRNERLEEVARLTTDSGDRLTSPLLPGLEIPLAELFATPPWQTDAPPGVPSR